MSNRLREDLEASLEMWPEQAKEADPMATAQQAITHARERSFARTLALNSIIEAVNRGSDLADLQTALDTVRRYLEQE